MRNPRLHRLRRLRRPGPPPGTSLVGWVTGPESPNETIKRFAITGTDLGIMWDNGDPANNQVLMAFGDTIGYCSVRGKQWRYNTMFRTKTARCPKRSASRMAWSTTSTRAHRCGRLRFPSRSSTASSSRRSETGIIPTSGIAVGDNAIHELHVDQELGQRRASGRRTSRRSRCPPTTASTGVSTRRASGRPSPDSVTASPLRSG